MKEKIVLLLLAALLTTGLAACGSKPAPSNTNSASSNTDAPADSGQTGKGFNDEYSETLMHTMGGTAVQPLAISSEGGLSNLLAQDLDGNAYTAADLAAYDLTMVNCWTTWCQYCIHEMPDLEELHQKLPENVNLISICFDADTSAATARSQVASTGITFPVLVGDENLQNTIGQQLLGYPTTFFVDSRGNIVGEMQVGVASGTGSVADAYMELINAALEQVK